MPAWLEALAYALARGAVRAWFDVQAERQLATREEPGAADLVRAGRFAAAVQLQRGAAGDPGRPDSAPAGLTGAPGGLGQHP